MPKRVSFPEDIYIKEDRWGKFYYTKIEFIFYHPIFIKPSITFSDYIFLKSIEIINRILSVCRGIKEDHYIKRVILIIKTSNKLNQ